MVSGYIMVEAMARERVDREPIICCTVEVYGGRSRCKVGVGPDSSTCWECRNLGDRHGREILS